MAKLFNNPGYSVVETNHIASVRNGRYKAQLEFKGEETIENGMLLVVDEVAKEIKFSADGKEAGIYLNVSEERIYEDALGRNTFALKGKDKYPKMARLSYGDVFETDAVETSTDIGTVDALKAALTAKTPIYGVAGKAGLIKLTKTVTDEIVVLQVVEIVRLPNNRQGIKFAAVKPV